MSLSLYGSNVSSNILRLGKSGGRWPKLRCYSFSGRTCRRHRGVTSDALQWVSPCLPCIPSIWNRWWHLCDMPRPCFKRPSILPGERDVRLGPRGTISLCSCHPLPAPVATRSAMPAEAAMDLGCSHDENW